MSIDDPIDVSLQLQFQTEKLRRKIQDCQDIKLLKEIAIELLELNKKKTAIIQWSSKRAFKAELANLKKF